MRERIDDLTAGSTRQFDSFNDSREIEDISARDPPSDEPEEPSDPDDYDAPCTDEDDSRWDVFIPDDDEFDPLPDPSDFWTTQD
jgi:hypothetical protein